MKGKFYLSVVFCVAFSFLTTSSAIAEPEVDTLKSRIDTLEKELKELKQLLQEEKQATKEEKTADKPVAKEAEAKAAPSIISQFQLKPYGYFKLDGSYDDSDAYPGNFILYMPNETGKHNFDSFNMTARQTRIGLQVLAPVYEGWSTQGKLELDFFGDGTKHENKAEPLLRHAYLEMTKGNFDLIAGQTFDVISPLNPYTLNYSVLWSMGNIGYRRPQLRTTYTMPLNDTNKLSGALAIARSVGMINEDLGGSSTTYDVRDANFPTIQARLGYATKSLTAAECIFGVSGHYGNEKVDFAYDFLNPIDEETLESWSLNADLTIPINTQLAIIGEIFTGKNIDDYFGGILQGINTTTRDGIESAGGWAQLNYKWAKKWQSNLGYGIDDPKNEDLGAGARSMNMNVYVNTLFNIIPPVVIGVEYSHCQTDYIGRSSGIDNRIQGSFIYNW